MAVAVIISTKEKSIKTTNDTNSRPGDCEVLPVVYQAAFHSAQLVCRALTMCLRRAHLQYATASRSLPLEALARCHVIAQTLISSPLEWEQL